MRLNQNTKLKQAGFAYRVGLFAQEMLHIKLPGLNQEERMVKKKGYTQISLWVTVGYYILVLIHKPVKTQGH